MLNSLEEKINFIKALVYIATLDNGITGEEKEYISQITKLYGIPENRIDGIYDDIIKTKDLTSVLSLITDRKTKLLFINELIALCYADNKYSQKEREGIYTISKILKIEQPKVIAIENLMEKRIQIEKESKSVLEMED